MRSMQTRVSVSEYIYPDGRDSVRVNGSKPKPSIYERQGIVLLEMRASRTDVEWYKRAKQVFAELVPAQVLFDQKRRLLEITAWSGHFAPVLDGAEVPIYQVIFKGGKFSRFMTHAELKEKWEKQQKVIIQ